MRFSHLFNELTMYVWLGGIALQGALAAIVLGRNVWRKFRFFTAYLLANLTFSCLLYLMANASRHTFFYWYWCTQFLMLILGLSVVFEIFTHLFAPYAALKRTAEKIFKCTAFLLAVCSAVVIFALPHGESGQSTTSAIFFLSEEVVRLVEVGLVAALFLSAGLFGLNWRQSEFGIALGIGTYATVDLVTVSLRNSWGSSAGNVLNFANMLAFEISLLIWMGYLLSTQVATPSAKAPEKGQLEQWNKVLTELIYQ